jgi:hypothetical protein
MQNVLPAHRSYGAQVSGNQYVSGSWYSPGDLYVPVAVAVCRDRGAFLSEKCSATNLLHYYGG